MMFPYWCVDYLNFAWRIEPKCSQHIDRQHRVQHHISIEWLKNETHSDASSGRKCVGVQHINYPKCAWNRETLWNVREWSPYVSLAQRVVFYFHFFRFFSAALSFVCVNFAVHSYALYASIWSTSSGISLPLSHVDGRSINNGLLRRSIWKTHKDTHRRMQTRTNACTKRTQADAHSRTHRQKSNFSIFCLAFTGGQCYLRHILLRRFLSSLPLRCDHFSYALVCR